MMEKAPRKELLPPTVADHREPDSVNLQTGSRAQPASVRELRSELQPFEKKSTTLAMTLFVVDVAVYVACFLCLAWLPGHLMLKAFLSVILGIHITRFFILGHDAAHGSLTGVPALNGILGRIALLPALHPFSLWQVGHNRVHHAFTNLKGIDFIWIPYSPEEFRSLPGYRRVLERFYRSVAGFGLYYLLEIWWKYLSPKGIKALKGRSAVYYLDVALVLACLASQIGLAPGAVLLTTVAPFLVWNWLMGFIIYNHHTHPSVQFFQKRSEWRFVEGQVLGTVHVVFPRPAGFLLNHIMEHVAHHLDVNIPSYRLRAAQNLVEQRLAMGLVIERWSVKRFLATLRACQLYDYGCHRWMRFAEAFKAASYLSGGTGPEIPPFRKEGI
jgi:omega-6 fatty acid desaturase (delta-12 desaturase)